MTTYFGEIKNFTTPKNAVDYNGHEYADLGLPSGTKWATMNVGVSTPEGSGDYYAWGETQPKTSYTLDNYKWKGLTTDELVSLGVVKKTSLLEIMELENNTKITATTQNGVKGFLLTSTINKKSIFLPGAGYWNENGLRGDPDFYRCTCWSASLNQYHDEWSDAIWIDNATSSGMKDIGYTGAERYFGSPVRPVTSY